MPQTECIVLSYNIRRLHCGYCLMAEFCAVPKWTIQDNAYTKSNKSFGVQKLNPPQIEGQWTVIKMITVGKAQCSKRLLRSIFYRWYDQWTLSESVKVQQPSKWGKFNSAQIKAVDGRSSPRFEGCTKLRIVHDGFLWCYASCDGQFCGISLFCD